MKTFYFNDIKDELGYSIADILEVFAINFNDYEKIAIQNPPLDSQTINYIIALKIISKNNLRVRFFRSMREKNLKNFKSDLDYFRQFLAKNLHCLNCGKEFKNASLNQKYCSNTCRQSAYRKRKNPYINRFGLQTHNGVSI